MSNYTQIARLTTQHGAPELGVWAPPCLPLQWYLSWTGGKWEPAPPLPPQGSSRPSVSREQKMSLPEYAFVSSERGSAPDFYSIHKLWIDQAYSSLVAFMPWFMQIAFPFIHLLPFIPLWSVSGLVPSTVTYLNHSNDLFLFLSLFCHTWTFVENHCY